MYRHCIVTCACRGLQSLTLSSLPHLKWPLQDLQLHSLANALTALSVSDCRSVSLAALQHTLQQFSLLCSLRICRCSQARPPSMAHLVAHLSNLTFLELRGAVIDEPGTLAQLTKLQHLCVAETGLAQADVDCLAVLTSLTQLDVSNTRVHYPPPLQKLKHLEMCNCELVGDFETAYALHMSQLDSTQVSMPFLGSLTTLSLAGARLPFRDPRDVRTTSADFRHCAALMSAFYATHSPGVFTSTFWV